MLVFPGYSKGIVVCFVKIGNVIVVHDSQEYFRMECFIKMGICFSLSLKLGRCVRTFKKIGKVI